MQKKKRQKGRSPDSRCVILASETFFLFLARPEEGARAPGVSLVSWMQGASGSSQYSSALVPFYDDGHPAKRARADTLGGASDTNIEDVPWQYKFEPRDAGDWNRFTAFMPRIMKADFNSTGHGAKKGSGKVIAYAVLVPVPGQTVGPLVVVRRSAELQVKKKKEKYQAMINRNLTSIQEADSSPLPINFDLVTPLLVAQLVARGQYNMELDDSNSHSANLINGLFDATRLVEYNTKVQAMMAAYDMPLRLHVAKDTDFPPGPEGVQLKNQLIDLERKVCSASTLVEFAESSSSELINEKAGPSALAAAKAVPALLLPDNKEKAGPSALAAARAVPALLRPDNKDDQKTRWAEYKTNMLQEIHNPKFCAMIQQGAQQVIHYVCELVENIMRMKSNILAWELMHDVKPFQTMALRKNNVHMTNEKWAALDFGENIATGYDTHTPPHPTHPSI